MTRNSIQNSIINVLSRLSEAEIRFNREPHSVKLLAVSKTRGIAEVEQAIEAGLSRFGENYLQDALAKIEYFSNLAKIPSIEWHFIGPIQSNKTAKIAENFHWVHSLDRISIAKRLSNQRPATLTALNVCIQINIDDASQKSGIKLQDCLDFATQISQLPNITLRGLMAVPEPSTELSQQRRPFHQIVELFKDLNSHGFQLDTLSLGMSSDLEAAIAEGSTMVRVGTDIFGPRQYQKNS